MELTLQAQDDCIGDDPVSIGTALVELFDGDNYLQLMDDYGQDFSDIASALTEGGTIKEKYLLPTSGKKTFVAVMSHVSLTKDASTLNGAHYIMENVWTILNNMRPGQIKVLIYDPYWDEDGTRDKTYNAALEAGFQMVDDDPTALYLPKIQDQNVPFWD